MCNRKFSFQEKSCQLLYLLLKNPKVSLLVLKFLPFLVMIIFFFFARNRSIRSRLILILAGRLLSFLLYRQKCSDFRFNKKEEHARYTHTSWLRSGGDDSIVDRSERGDSLLAGGSTCVQPPTLPDYDRGVMIYCSWWL